MEISQWAEKNILKKALEPVLPYDILYSSKKKDLGCLLENGFKMGP